MPDLKSTPNPLFLRDDELRQGIELLFFGYRDFTARADQTLAAYDFGRAHHRVIYFVGRNPGMTVSDLLDILKITKQSLSRVLSQLVREGFIVQRPGTTDRRQRLLSLTDKGAELERRLTEDQRALVARAYKAAGAEAVEGFKKVLLGLVNEEDRIRFRATNTALPGQSGPSGSTPSGSNSGGSQSGGGSSGGPGSR
ncbi:MAG: MarR family transcriptional regulator [Rhodospirillaceae bacterium]|nr:MarR family transcriptional regulator [Rhodospirillaceae bacterium]